MSRTYSGDTFKVRVPEEFTLQGAFFRASLRVYDDEPANDYTLSFGRDVCTDESVFIERFHQMWGDVSTSLIPIEYNETKWKVLAYSTDSPVYQMNHHYLAYHAYADSFYSVWFGMRERNTGIVQMFMTILQTYTHTTQITHADTRRVYMHYNPQYTVVAPEGFEALSSAEEYGLISDVLPTMFIKQPQKCRFFINVTPLNGVPKDTCQDIIATERKTLEAEKKTRMLDKKKDTCLGQECWTDTCITEVNGDTVKCMVKYLYHKEHETYIRISYSAPETTFSSLYFTEKIPYIVQSISLPH